MKWAFFLKDAAEFCLAAAPDETRPLLMLVVMPLGIRVEGSLRNLHYRHLVSFDEIEQAKINPLLSAIELVESRLSVAVHNSKES